MQEYLDQASINLSIDEAAQVARKFVYFYFQSFLWQMADSDGSTVHQTGPTGRLDAHLEHAQCKNYEKV